MFVLVCSTRSAEAAAPDALTSAAMRHNNDSADVFKRPAKPDSARSSAIERPRSETALKRSKMFNA